LNGKALAPIYISIAITFSDCKDYEQALKYYEKEMELRTGELKEV